MVEPDAIGRIDWIGRSIRINLSRDTITAADAGHASTSTALEQSRDELP
jgi:hypothetical protein